MNWLIGLIYFIVVVTLLILLAWALLDRAKWKRLALRQPQKKKIRTLPSDGDSVYGDYSEVGGTD